MDKVDETEQLDKVDETEQLDKTRTRAIYLRLQDFGSKIMFSIY